MKITNQKGLPWGLEPKSRFCLWASKGIQHLKNLWNEDEDEEGKVKIQLIGCGKNTRVCFLINSSTTQQKRVSNRGYKTIETHEDGCNLSRERIHKKGKNQIYQKMWDPWLPRKVSYVGRSAMLWLIMVGLPIRAWRTRIK
jgi:hypothetical protein